MADKNADRPADRRDAGKKAREERLSRALRANLRSRKAAARPDTDAAAPQSDDADKPDPKD